MANVAVRQRAEDRVGERMECNVGIGMTDEAAGMGHLDTAQGDESPIAETVDVETAADPNASVAARKDRFCPGKIVGGRHFEIILRPLNQHDIETRTFGDRSVVGQAVFARGGAVGCEDGVETKPLGSLGPPQIGPLDRRRDQAVAVGALEGVDDGQPGDRALMVG